MNEELLHLGTELEMANAQLRGWRDFFSGQPKDMPFTESGAYAKNSQLNFAWTLGYESAQDSELFKLMVGRADRAMNHSQELANQLAEASQCIEALREQAQLYIDQREMTLAAKRELEQRIEALQAELVEWREDYEQMATNHDASAKRAIAAEAKVEALTAANTELRKLLRAARERERSDSQDVQDELAEARAESPPSWQPGVEAVASWLRSFREPMWAPSDAEIELVAEAHAMAAKLDSVLAPAAPPEPRKDD